TPPSPPALHDALPISAAAARMHERATTTRPSPSSSSSSDRPIVVQTPCVPSSGLITTANAAPGTPRTESFIRLRAVTKWCPPLRSEEHTSELQSPDHL